MTPLARALAQVLARRRARRRVRRIVDVGSYGRWELTRAGWRLRPPEPRTPIDRYRDAGVM